MFSNYLEPYFLQVVFEMISYYYQHFCIILDISNILFKHRASCYILVPSQGSSWSGLQKGPASLTMWIFSALKADSSSLLQEQDLSLLPPSDPLRTWSGQRSPANRVQFFPESKHEVQRTIFFWTSRPTESQNFTSKCRWQHPHIPHLSCSSLLIASSYQAELWTSDGRSCVMRTSSGSWKKAHSRFISERPIVFGSKMEP